MKPTPPILANYHPQMFPNSISSSSSEADDHHQLAMLDRFLSNDVNAIAPNYSKHLLPPSFLFPFSPSFANDLNEFIFQYQHQHQDLIPPHYHPLLDSSSTHTIADHQSHETNRMPFSSGKVIGLATNTKTSTTTTTTSVDPSSTSSMKIITQQQETSTTTTPRKRSAKKDRHSKIVTAQGLRDRRMRLSLDIARRFFTLQDMLGFDKASKTVEWLLTKSRSAIKELSRGFSHDQITKTSTAGSSTSSECEVISGVDNEEDQDLDDQDDQVMKCSSDRHQGPASRKEKRTSRLTRKATFHPQARESRAKARARARERTMERRLWSRRSSSDHHQQQQQLPFDEDQSSHSYDVKSNNVEKPQSSDQTTPIIDNVMKKSSFVNSELSAQSSSILGCSNRNLAGFDENWELHRHPISTGEVLENRPTSCSSSFSLVPNFDTRLQSQFADHSTTRFCSNINWETYNDPNQP